MKNFLITMLSCAIFSLMSKLYLMTFYPSEASDYNIDLREDSILIHTDLNKDTTIHFDDLEEFIIKDNI